MFHAMRGTDQDDRSSMCALSVWNRVKRCYC